ncbi:MAG: tetratricopeptide repeat protein, partial [Candidatus Omnitrophica bacterium]|nr:tetratricopeptide repeat protein [Candidatus Omnitrophota bacterium]
YYKLGMYSEVIQALEKAIELNPNDAGAYNNLGRTYYELGRYSEAIQAYKKGIELDSKNAIAYNNLGSAYFNLEDYSQAIQAYKKAVELNPSDAEAHYNLGNAYSKLGRYSEAIKALEKAVELNPKYADAYYNLGYAYYELGRYPEAREILIKLEEVAPNYYDTSALLKLIDEAIGQKEKDKGDLPYLGEESQAILLGLEKAVESNPSDAKAHYKLGNAYYKLGRYPQAIQSYKKVIELDPKNINVYIFLGFLYYESEKYSQAILAYEKAIELDFMSAKPYFGLGIIYFDLGEYSQAIQVYKKAIELDPKLAIAYNNLGNAYARLEEYSQAIPAYKKAIELEPKFADAYYNLGVSYYKLKRYPEAREKLIKSGELNPILEGEIRNLLELIDEAIEQKGKDKGSLPSQLQNQQLAQAYLMGFVNVASQQIEEGALVSTDNNPYLHPGGASKGLKGSNSQYILVGNKLQPVEKKNYRPLTFKDVEKDRWASIIKGLKDKKIITAKAGYSWYEGDSSYYLGGDYNSGKGNIGGSYSHQPVYDFYRLDARYKSGKIGVWHRKYSNSNSQGIWGVDLGGKAGPLRLDNSLVRDSHTSGRSSVGVQLSSGKLVINPWVNASWDENDGKFKLVSHNLGLGVKYPGLFKIYVSQSKDSIAYRGNVGEGNISLHFLYNVRGELEHIQLSVPLKVGGIEIVTMYDKKGMNLNWYSLLQGKLVSEEISSELASLKLATESGNIQVLLQKVFEYGIYRGGVAFYIPERLGVSVETIFHDSKQEYLKATGDLKIFDNLGVKITYEKDGGAEKCQLKLPIYLGRWEITLGATDSSSYENPAYSLKVLLDRLLSIEIEKEGKISEIEARLTKDGWEFRVGVTIDEKGEVVSKWFNLGLIITFDTHNLGDKVKNKIKNWLSWGDKEEKPSKVKEKKQKPVPSNKKFEVQQPGVNDKDLGKVYREVSEAAKEKEEEKERKRLEKEDPAKLNNLLAKRALAQASLKIDRFVIALNKEDSKQLIYLVNDAVSAHPYCINEEIVINIDDNGNGICGEEGEISDIEKKAVNATLLNVTKCYPFWNYCYYAKDYSAEQIVDAFRRVHYLIEEFNKNQSLKARFEQITMIKLDNLAQRMVIEGYEDVEINGYELLFGYVHGHKKYEFEDGTSFVWFYMEGDTINEDGELVPMPTDNEDCEQAAQHAVEAVGKVDVLLTELDKRPHLKDLFQRVTLISLANLAVIDDNGLTGFEKLFQLVYGHSIYDWGEWKYEDAITYVDNLELLKNMYEALLSNNAEDSFYYLTGVELPEEGEDFTKTQVETIFYLIYDENANLHYFIEKGEYDKAALAVKYAEPMLKKLQTDALARTALAYVSGKTIGDMAVPLTDDENDALYYL